MKYNILLIDDDKEFRDQVSLILTDFHVLTAENLEEARDKLTSNLDLVLLDLVLDENKPDAFVGKELIPELHNKYPDLPIIVITSYPNYEISFEVANLGAKDFISKKNLDWSEWKNRIQNYCTDYRKIKKLKRETNKGIVKNHEIIGKSNNIEYVRRRLKDLAINNNKTTILLTGETGTGKNLAVKFFRSHSKRRDKPYQEFSISEKSENVLESELFGHKKGAFTGANSNKIGLFESANRGILFLDEIGDYSLQIQSKIMRFLDNREITPVGSTRSKKIDVQLIMATNKDLRRLIAARNFREDLFYRINRININFPPLRERRGDIPLLTNYFFTSFTKKERTNLQKISPEVYEIFEKYHWPGNVRELQSQIWNACTEARLTDDKVLSKKHIKNELLISEKGRCEYSFKEYRQKIKEVELRAIDKALAKTMGQKTKAAELLDMTADQLRYKVNTAKKNFEIMLEKFENIRKYY